MPVTLALWGQREENCWALLAASLDKKVSSLFRERPCLGIRLRVKQEDNTFFYLPTHPHMHTHTERDRGGREREGGMEDISRQAQLRQFMTTNPAL